MTVSSLSRLEHLYRRMGEQMYQLWMSDMKPLIGKPLKVLGVLPASKASS
jgi:hypothetical protein